MSTSQSGMQRLHELDALRAFAMFLGIALHAALSFAIGFPWIVRDEQATWAFTWIFWAIHGFRMPLFILISGYFTMMLWRRKGLAALIKQRTYRVLFPLLISLVTILPSLFVAIIVAVTISQTQRPQAREVQTQVRTQSTSLDETPSEKSQEIGHDASRTLPAEHRDLPVEESKAASPPEVAMALRVESIRAQYQEFLQSPWLKVPVPEVGAVSIFDLEILIHLWFLWFLCWLVAFFALFVGLFSVIPVPRVPNILIVSPLRWLWILPLTMLPQLFMGIDFPAVGPDTSASLLPKPHVLFYYAIFFFFGALYYDCNDLFGRLGKWWRVELPIALFVVFPLAVFTFNRIWMPDFLAQALPQRSEALERIVISGILQVIYVWLMSFGLIGLFRTCMRRETKAVRYLSDASYWFYLAHLTPMVLIQALVRTWPVPSWIKFLFVCVLTCLILLVTYQYMVRYTWVGRLLNGPRVRTQPQTKPLPFPTAATPP